MEKTIQIGDKEIQLKATAAILLRYQMQFHRDALKDIFSLFEGLNVETLSSSSTQQISLSDSLQLISKIDIVIFQQLMWVMAKTANKDIPDFLHWLDSFDEFPIFDCINDIIELLLGCLMTVKKKQIPMN